MFIMSIMFETSWEPLSCTNYFGIRSNDGVMFSCSPKTAVGYVWTTNATEHETVLEAIQTRRRGWRHVWTKATVETLENSARATAGTRIGTTPTNTSSPGDHNFYLLSVSVWRATTCLVSFS